MKRLFIATIVAAIAALTACNKSAEEIKSGNAIVAKWNLIRYTGVTVQGSFVRKDTGNYAAGSFMQFESNGQCIIRETITTQSYWKLLDNNKTLWIQSINGLDVPDNGFEIKTLADHDLVLYAKEGSATNYDEVTIYAQK